MNNIRICVILTLLIKPIESVFLDDTQISRLKWADGIAAVLFSMFWIFRQWFITRMYSGQSLENVKTMYITAFSMSVLLFIGMLLFIIIAAVLCAFKDVTYPNTLVIFVGFAISIVLDKRRQFSICKRTRLMSNMLKKDKYRIGYLTLGKVHEGGPHSIGIFKITKNKIPENVITQNEKWSGLKYKVNNKFFIEDWGTEHRIYGMDTERMAKQMGKHGEWRDCFIEASLCIGWLPTYYVNDDLFNYLINFAQEKRSIRTSIETWKGQVVGLQGIHVNGIQQIVGAKSVNNILGLYTLALMEEPYTSRQWLSNCERHLKAMYDNNTVLPSIQGNIIDIINT